MKKSCIQYLAKLDVFGYPVSLYYHENKQKKKSVVGFIITVFMLLVATTYFVFMALRVGDPEY